MTVTADTAAALNADGLVVPGVGAFAACMAGLRAIGGDDDHRQAAGRLPGRFSASAWACRSSSARESSTACAPRAAACCPAWCSGSPPRSCRTWAGTRSAPRPAARCWPGCGAGHPVLLRALLRGHRDRRRCPGGLPTALTWPRHGQDFVAVVEHGPLCATQFHPEKSADAGADAAGQLAGDALMPGRITLLPAVDVSRGQAVQLVQGEAGRETAYGDPVAAAMRLAAGRRRVDPPGRPRRRLRPRRQRRAARHDDRPRWASASSCPAASATTPRSPPRSAPAAQRVVLGTAALENPGLGPRR